MNGSEDRAIRIGAGAAVLLVAGIAAVVSFIHIQDLAATHGQTWLAAVLLPFSIDGTIAASSLVLLRAARRQLDAPVLAQGMLLLAVVATLAANVTYGIPYGWTGALLSGWPAVAFIGCAEMAIMMVRKTAKPVSPGVSTKPPWAATPVRQIMAEEKARGRGVSSKTAQTIQRREAAVAKAMQNGHGSA